jgi:two-component system sensor histidine kinase RegB
MPHLGSVENWFEDEGSEVSRRLRLTTLLRLRWLADAGQALAVLFTAYVLNFPLPTMACLALIGLSAALNIYLTFHYPQTHRLTPAASFGILAYDVMQLSGLLYLTGGMTNPFVFLITAPVIISATSLPFLLTCILGAMVVISATILSFFHFPLPWHQTEVFAAPNTYVAGMWFALVSSLAFTAIYAFKVAEEARQLATALNAAELVLQREQHLTALDGLAAAAAHELGTPLATITVVIRELEKSLSGREGIAEDIALLRSQAERCREILKRLTSLSTEEEEHFSRMPFTSLVEEIVAPHRNFGVEIETQKQDCIGREPVGRRNPGVIYGLGNFVENAVDFARSRVLLRWRWDQDSVMLSIIDDGPGFPVSTLDRLGEPYTTNRTGRADEAGGGLGLGVFIAKTLLERSGASIRFQNGSEPGLGAVVEIRWPRGALDDAPAIRMKAAE